MRLLALVGAAIAMVAALPSPAGARQMQPQLIDQKGHVFTLQSLRGTPLAVTFVSAHCTDACPLINAQFSRAEAAFRAQHRRVHLLTVTLDPEHDSLATMAHLARSFHADPALWQLASGRLADVHAVMSAFGVIAQRGRNGYADVHTTFVYLLDAQGRLRQTMLASTNLDRRLVAEVQKQWHVLAT